jgi:endogenous inhibitor of DNA gyrase (YacG/DUF329 family)
MRKPRGAARAEAAKRGRGCPICGKPSDPASSPFCSRRCRQVDLNRWLSGAYVVAGHEGEGPKEGDEE